MPSLPGTRIGPYEIIGKIGAGGMGEVYRARDTQARPRRRHQGSARGLRSDPDRAGALRAGGAAVAALSHPNILAIHDFGDRRGAPSTP